MPEPDTTDHEASAFDRRALSYRAALGFFTLVMLGLSWPLWVGAGSFPRVPFAPGLPTPGPALAWCRFAGLMVAVAAGVWWPRVWMLAVLLLTWLVLEDQHRFQPWAYQFVLCGLALARLPAGPALACCRMLLVALYFHSGLSKLDATFSREMGPLFLSVLLRPAGIDPFHWPEFIRETASLGMPLSEAALGLGLIHPTSRRLALPGVVVLHLLLIGILGPWWGLGHSTIVLLWNAGLIVENVVLFGSGPPRWSSLWKPGRRWATAPVVALFGAAVTLPLGERWEVWDTWPSFALYASHAERTFIEIHKDDVAFYPPSIRDQIAPGSDSPWRRIDLTGWSRDERGTPPYPQGRAANGVAEALSRWNGRPHLVRVQQWSRADRFRGQRTRLEAIGSEAIFRLGERYRLNAHPADR